MKLRRELRYGGDCTPEATTGSSDLFLRSLLILYQPPRGSLIVNVARTTGKPSNRPRKRFNC